MDHLPSSESAPEAALDINAPWRRPDFWGFFLGPIAMVIWLCMPGVWEDPANRLLGVWILTLIWWITEPIPIPATGMLAIGLIFFFGIPQQVLLNQKVLEQKSLEQFALGQIPVEKIFFKDNSSALQMLLNGFREPTFFFLMGGMFLGLAMMRHGLDRRFALSILCAPGMSSSPARVLLAIGVSVGTISMFISNTAATAIVFPIALQILKLLEQGQPADTPESQKVSRSKYGTALLLMAAYASSVGGISTPIGTTTNVVAMGNFKETSFKRGVNFFYWMELGIPLMILLFGLLYLLMWWYCRATKLEMANVREKLLELKQQLGPWKRGEINTAIVFIMAMLCWTVPGIISMIDLKVGNQINSLMPEELIALLVPVALYLLPIRPGSGQGTLVGEDLSRIDWGTLILFGTSLTLGNLVAKTGLAARWANEIHHYWPNAGTFELIGIAALAGIVLSELSSNAAAAATLLPVIWSMSGESPETSLGPMIAVTFGASFGSALPVSTPPNTLVYSSGKIPMRRMITVGLLFDVLCWVVVWFGVYAAIELGWSPWL